MVTFDSKIRELEESKSELDLSILESKKQEYQNRIAEILESQIAEWGERDAINELKECHRKIKEIDYTMWHIPETLENINKKIALCQEKKESVKNIPLYKDTEEWLANIFWTDLIEYARETNNEELLNKLRTRSLSEEEYRQYFEQDYHKHDEDQKMYEELPRPEDQTTIESKPAIELPEWMSDEIKEMIEDSEEFKCLSANDVESFLKKELKKNFWEIKDKHIRNKFKWKDEYKAALKLIGYIAKKYPEFMVIKTQSPKIEVQSKSKNEKLVEDAIQSKSWESVKDKEKNDKMLKLKKIKKIDDAQERCQKYIELFEELWCNFSDKQDFLQQLIDVTRTRTHIQLENGIQSILTKIIQTNLKPEESEWRWYLSYKLNPSYDAWRIIAYPNGEIFTICPHDEYEKVISKKPPVDKRRK